jgi:hypothetical protein
MNRFEDSFKSKLAGIDFETIENSPHSIFALSSDLKLIYFNQAWMDFAKQNNGEPGISSRFALHSSFESGVSGLLKDFYIESFKKAIRELKVWEHEYECSSSGNYRLYHLVAYPLKNGEGIIVVNSLQVDRIIDESFREISTLSIDEYKEPDGMITQCSNCRRTKRINPSDTWDWVPTLVEESWNNINYSICPICYDYYFSSARVLPGDNFNMNNDENKSRDTIT